MKYVGFYWTLFAPMMKKSIAARFNQELAEQSIREGKTEYRRLLSRADDLGPGNPMATNAYFAYVFAGAWLGSGKRITPNEMALVIIEGMKCYTVEQLETALKSAGFTSVTGDHHPSKPWITVIARK